MLRIDTGPTEPIEWPSREEWAVGRRTFYADEVADAVHVSEKPEAYGSPEEVQAVLAEAKSLWAEMGRELKTLGPAISDAEWRRLWREAGSREAKRALEGGGIGRRICLRYDRSRLNLDIIKQLSKGWLPLGNDFGFASVDKRLPVLAELQRRYRAAWDEALEAKEREYAARPIDDEAWEKELQRRANIEARRNRVNCL